MVDGYSKVYDYGFVIILCIRRYGKWMDSDCGNSSICNNAGVRFNINRKREKGELTMGAIVVSVYVSLVAIIGFAYFTYQDRKENKHKV